MFVPMKVVVHMENCITNHGLIKLIIMDALECQGRSWEEFMSRRMRTSCWKQDETSADTPKEARVTEDQG